MTENDRMKNLDDIEFVAKRLGLTTRRNSVRSLTCIQIRDTSGEWIMFDPISRGKDFARMIFAGALKSGVNASEVEFRKTVLLGFKDNDFTLS
jgi:hypothetical protein